MWMLFDDETVTVVPPSRVEAAIVSEAAYLLFYRRKHPTATHLVHMSLLG
jgi:hypothetical protein